MKVTDILGDTMMSGFRVSCPARDLQKYHSGNRSNCASRRRPFDFWLQNTMPRWVFGIVQAGGTKYGYFLGIWINIWVLY